MNALVIYIEEIDPPIPDLLMIADDKNDETPGLMTDLEESGFFEIPDLKAKEYVIFDEVQPSEIEEVSDEEVEDEQEEEQEEEEDERDEQ